MCRRRELEDAAAEEEQLVTTIADANFGLIPDDGDDTSDLAAVGRRIQVLQTLNSVGISKSAPLASLTGRVCVMYQQHILRLD